MLVVGLDAAIGQIVADLARCLGEGEVARDVEGRDHLLIRLALHSPLAPPLDLPLAPDRDPGLGQDQDQARQPQDRGRDQMPVDRGLGGESNFLLGLGLFREDMTLPLLYQMPSRHAT